MKLLIALLIILAGGLDRANAQVCITGIEPADGLNSFQMSYDDWQSEAPELDWLMTGEMVHKASLTCQQIDVFSDSLEVTSMALSGFALYSACTGVGLKAAVFAQSAVIGLQAINLVVSNLDCVDSDQETKIQRKVDEAVCNALEAKGISCYPPIKINQI